MKWFFLCHSVSLCLFNSCQVNDASVRCPDTQDHCLIKRKKITCRSQGKSFTTAYLSLKRSDRQIDKHTKWQTGCLSIFSGVLHGLQDSEALHVELAETVSLRTFAKEFLAKQSDRLTVWRRTKRHACPCKAELHHQAVFMQTI